LDTVEKLESPLDGYQLMEHFGKEPGRWIKYVKDYLENEVVEGRLSQDDEGRAWELAEAYVREYNLFREEE
jgi:poly(A) polymerase